ncbi:hypothetical protein EOD39_16145 [Acipenser ruthenus]|uniref:Uncharacterized protein n=1 Tax=Acipenser ruthenus TaxID=7906 RepID=A0A444V6L7_ACIRT|nr:hypothetical protein EOD39_16145 [Acipenser ruthenus]
MIGLNKTDTQNAVALEGTLSSIMTIKMSDMEPSCFKYEPPAEVIKACKSATTVNMQQLQMLAQNALKISHHVHGMNQNSQIFRDIQTQSYKMLPDHSNLTGIRNIHG